MKQKVKLGRKLLGFLLTLAMVVGLMPGMSLTAYATDVTEYSLWVAGTRVTSENASNIDGSSKVSYNANTNTLTLDNYSNSAVQHENGNRNVITSEGDLNIVLKGENNLTNIGDESVLGIYCSSSGNLNISGEGSLNIETKYDCIQTDGNVTIDSGTITITGIGYGKGISSASGNVIINGGELTIINKSDCIYTNNGGTTINGGNITLKSTDSAGIYGERFTIAGGTVDVDAKTGGIRSAYETTISDGKVTVKAIGDGNNSFGISGGNSLKVSGGTVTAEATGNGDCNGIWGSEIAFEGGTITAVATGASNSNGISGGQITIKGGTVTAEATGTGENSSGINGFVSLQGGTVTAKGGKIGVLGGLEILDTITSFIASGTEGAVDGWVQNKVAGTGWTDVDDTGAGVDIEVSSTYRKLSETYKKVKFPAEKKQAATITKVPTAKTLTYNGQAQELVTAGEAEGGEMQYAIGKDATTAPTEGWSAAIPSKTDAGTYYVWYKVKGDNNHLDSDAACVTVTIKEAATDEGEKEVSTDVKSDGKSPALKADNLTNEFAESTLTSDEKAKVDKAVAAGEKVDIDVYLEIKDIADSVAAADKDKVKAVVADANDIEYFDISLFKELFISNQSQGATALHTLSSPLKLTIGVPKSFPSVANGYTRTYVVIRLHDGKAEKLPTSLNADGTISFETDKFSTYALAYTDVQQEAAAISMNAGLKISQTGSKINIKWGKVNEADGYDVYVTYCGKKFGKAAKTVKKNSTTSVKITKINGKKINLKKNYKVYVAAYKMVDGKKKVLAKTIMGHVVGRKNTKYSNAKKITLSKSSYTVKVGKTAKIKAKTVLVQKGKKQLSNAHAAEFRYASSNKKIATVDKNGKIKGIAKGTCTIYVYARNGYAKTVKVTVK